MTTLQQPPAADIANVQSKFYFIARLIAWMVRWRSFAVWRVKVYFSVLSFFGALSVGVVLAFTWSKFIQQ